ncbi:MAG: hypothetical protein OXQ94_15725 [Gemmatimonadota bacterium]|nr:hypothetical protein [Gemmatimonadota bacterium]MDE2873127.1 hypothetical protein [Gemmatimonadota bacterium]
MTCSRPIPIAATSMAMALSTILSGSGLEAQAVGDRVRASLADRTVIGEVTAVSEQGFHLDHKDGEVSLPFADLVKLERSVGRKSAWLEGYVVGATILVYPGIQLINTCLGDPTMGDDAFLTIFCMIFLIAPGIALVAAGVVITGPIGAIVGAFLRTDAWEQITVPGHPVPPALRSPPVQSFERQRLEMGFRIPIR